MAAKEKKAKKEKKPKKEKAPKPKKEKKGKKADAAVPEGAEGEEGEGGGGGLNVIKIVIIAVPAILLLATAGLFVFLRIRANAPPAPSSDVIAASSEEDLAAASSEELASSEEELGSSEKKPKAKAQPAPMSAAEVASSVRSLHPSVLGLEGDSMEIYEILPLDGSVQVDGEPCTKIMIYDSRKSGLSAFVGDFLVSRTGNMRVYKIDNATHQVTQLDITPPEGVEISRQPSLKEYDEGFAAGYAAAQAAMAAQAQEASGPIT